MSDRVEIDGPLPGEHWPLTAYQRDIMAVAARNPSLPLTQMSGWSHIDGALDADRIRRCAELAVRRNDALRTRIITADGELRQFFSNIVPPLEVFDFLGEPDPHRACQDWMAEANRRAMPADGPLVRMAVLVDSPDSFYLYANKHHVAGDAWAVNLMLGQIIAEYESATPTGVSAEYAMPSYRAFIERASAYRDSEAWVADRDWFLDYLDGVEPALCPRTATLDTVRRGSTTLRLDPGLVAGLRETGVSIFSFTAAAISVFLAGVHRTDEVVLGVPMLNREPAEMFTAGHFANMIPLRVSLAGNPTLGELGARVADSVRHLKKRQRFAYGDIARGLAERHAALPTLFDVTYSYNRMPSSDHLERLMERSKVFGAGTVADAINIVAVESERDGTVDLHVFESQDVFDADFPLPDALRRVGRLVRAALAEPHLRISELPWLSDAESAALAEVECGPVVSIPETTIADLFAGQVDSDPGAVAVVGEQGSLTYAELSAAADSVASALRRAGVRAEEPVPVIAPRSHELLAAIYGVLSAAGAYVPIDPKHPAERIATILAESGARFVVTDLDLPAEALGPDMIRIPIAALAAPPAEAESTSGTAPAADGLAYVIFTSGSTGRPKGVMVEHRAVVNRLDWMQRAYPLDRTDVILQKTPATFDVSVWELMWWAITGARVALLAPGGERDPRTIVEAIERHGVTVMHFVPSMLGPFLTELEAAPETLRRIGSLRRVFCSGEALPAELVNRFARAFARTENPPQLVNLYGPTEATVDVSSFDLPVGEAEVSRVPIGWPIQNIALSVLDEHGRRVPPGMPGELGIAGIGLARGYLGRPELTEAAFVADDRMPGGRRYRTGDIVRRLADGSLEYLGRRDDQVKIRGNRVTLGEVENTLLGLPGVGAAAVIDLPAPRHGTTLVGFFAADETGGADTDTVAARLADRLPAYMVPSRFVEVASIPLTSNGKADRRALAALAAETSTADRDDAPRTEVERTLVEAVEQVLGTRLGVHDNFFTHGGDSILALALRTAVERRGLYLDVDVLFTRPTIAELATHVTATPDHEPGVRSAFELVPLVDRAALHTAEDAFPVTALQLGMLFHAAESAESTLYKDVFRYRLDLSWRAEEFGAAVDAVVATQPALRSSFDLTGFSVPLQIVHRDLPARWSVVTGAAPAEIGDYIEQRRHAAYPLGRTAEPLYEIRVFADAEGIDLVFSFHHAILDGWSVATVIRSLVQDYLRRCGSPLPAPIRPADAAHILAEYARAEQRADADPAHSRYWQEFLAGATPTALPALRPHMPGDTAPVRSRVTHLLPRGLQTAVERFAAKREIGLKTLFLTAHCLALRALTGADDITTGVIGHGRPGRADAEAVAGLFLNTVPMRLDDRARTWSGAIEQIARRERESHPHRRYPLRSMLGDLAAAGNGRARGTTIFDTAFNFVNYHTFDVLAAVDGVRLRDVEVFEETDFAALLTVATDPRTGRILVRADGDHTLTVDQCDALVTTCVRVLTCLIEDEEAPIDLGADRIRTGGLAQLIAEQAARKPEQIAVRDASGVWTYDEFGERVDRIAAALLALGLPYQARVAVLMDRRPELIATVVALAKVGAVCVPLDVGYPEQRLRMMIERAAPARVLADARYAGIVTDPDLVLDAAELTDPGIEPLGIAPVVAESAAAYVLFTSGSTGEPKGVVMPHRSLANLVGWQNRAVTGRGIGSTLQYAPLSFDVSFQEIFATLTAGATLRPADAEHRADMRALLDTVVDERIERMYLPFVALQAFSETAVTTGRYPVGLKVLVSSGEQLRLTPEIRQFLAAVPGIVLENQYGPTETHVAVAHTMTGDPRTWPDLPPIGHPIDGAQAHVLDHRLRPVPAGVEGEIYLGGDTPAHGYEGRGGLTAQRFVPAGPGGRIVYRTGDLGVRLPSGELICRGRADTQVKIRGFRVEPAEVELRIGDWAARHGGIKEVAVVARRFGGTDAALTAFLVGDELATETTALAEHLRILLPAHMVPARFVWLDDLPRTPSGKRDDARLRELPLDTAPEPEESLAPRDEIEAAIAEVMAEYAGVRHIGVDQSFFDLGGTSVGAMRVVLALNKRWDADIALDTFLRAPTAAALAAIVRNDSSRRGFDPIVPLRTGGSGTPLFLIHPIGGNVLCYIPLIRHLPGDRPVYGLQAAGADVGSVPLRSMRELAQSYLAAIRRVHPEGPCHVAGWSFGGYVALELAGQLPRTDLASVTLLDTIALREGHRPRLPEPALMKWFFLELLWYARDAQAAEFEFDESITGTDELFDAMLTESVAAGILPAGGSSRAIRRLYDIFAANVAAVQDYRLEPIDADVTLMRATDGLPPGVDMAHQIAGTMFDSESNGWADHVRGELSIVTIPGDHLSMMIEPNVETVAATLAATLHTAESATTGRR
ncbi:amino acid adenylation domain-containing protein [Nocardia shimofusensis]|uniref:amino acid adenylation domain-containing protein n=1 Tax=Nocardia shimofusensis TaxID=228596 RepID=UPI00082FC6AB|nr:non-ribosomal peptide synthetase [Nocardia shimofusensis]